METYSAYTENLEDMKLDISVEDENFGEELLAVAGSFRRFDEALSEFIAQHGYNGGEDTDSKVEFISGKFVQAGITVPREIKRWFGEFIKIKRTTAFQICFAFGLDVKSTEDFFRTVYLERCFDCHLIEEAVYYFAIKNSLPYSEAEKLMVQADKDTKGRIDFNGEVLYTGAIVKEIQGFSQPQQLIDYFKENIRQFGYNNATAYKNISSVWEEISAENGIANREYACSLTYDTENEHKNEKFNVMKKRSLWKIYVQIMGYDKDDVKKLHSDRSIKPVLENNALIHPLAAESFPDREALNKILIGEHKSGELTRKMLILLLFYRYWATLKISGKDNSTGYENIDRFFDTVNRYLINSGYNELYYGNPYDWIFMYCADDVCPLEAFRYFMRELYTYKLEHSEGKSFHQ